MSESSTISWVWWITAVEVPVLGCLFWLIHQGRREAEHTLLKLYREIQSNLNMVLENLALSKLEGARLYATIADLKDVEKRLTDHLLRLESRVTYALQAAPPITQWRRERPESREPIRGGDDSDAA
ncbi:MAG: hypothetical protein ACREH6_01075 [Geminicoccaceae bacterium]